MLMSVSVSPLQGGNTTVTVKEGIFVSKGNVCILAQVYKNSHITLLHRCIYTLR